MTPSSESTLVEDAAAVLHTNDLGGWTKASPRLYPHQWSWDSAFIAIGLARLDSRRAARELHTLFRAQWANGMVPHIVFDPSAGDGYFPGHDRWACAARNEAAPAEPRTSGLCQPPAHAIGARAVWHAAQGEAGTAVAEARAFLVDLYPRLLAWHEYLATARDPEGTGLVTIYHPWESGCDNSPRWDAALAAVEVGTLLPYRRRDLAHVVDPGERPSGAEYDRYLWLVESLKQAGYDDAVALRRHPFQVRDVLFSALLVAANEALLDVAGIVDAPMADRRRIRAWLDRGHAGLAACWDERTGLGLDYDVRAGRPVPVRTIAGFAPLIAGSLAPDRLEAQLAVLDSSWFCAAPGMAPPSTSPLEPAFLPHSYWRGPSWPIMNWLLWWSLERGEQQERAERLRRTALDQVARSGFAEYFNPFTGEPLGSRDQSWTAAVVLDWLAPELARQHSSQAA
ncbi:MAG: glycogen debranching protein [Actinomycetota bacterium]|nr:glycogen debranching protein [Actinomycetota bacterium]